MKKNNKIIVYQSNNGGINFRGDFSNDNIWGTQNDIANLFNKDQSVISRHIKNIFKDKEVSEKSNMQKMHITNSDKPVVLYSLDVILSVGYRTNSVEAIKFRSWSTQILKKYLVDGYAINKKQVVGNYNNFSKSFESIKKLVKDNNLLGSDEILDLVKVFADTWVSLDAYDKSKFPKTGLRKKKVIFMADELLESIGKLKTSLIKKKEATDLFAQEKNKGSFAGIVGNVFQSFGGKDLYPTIEEKAAHLLYFVVKGHVFNDGNKRSGAYSFVWLLQKAQILNKENMSTSVLTTLTLLIAESDPKEKDRVIGLVLLLLRK